jgi:hypothetical protein
MPVTLNINSNDSLKDVLKGLMGNRVELAVKGGQSYNGKLTIVGDNVVIISELSGKEFYDAVISIDDIAAVEVRVRDR